MAIGACHDSRAAGHGDRVRAKAVVKHAPLGRQAADILVLHVFAQYSSIDSPRLRGMIVGKDEKDVRASRVRSGFSSAIAGEADAKKPVVMIS